VAGSGLDVRWLLAGSKMLQDQAELALSAFGEVPGGEVWEVLQAAVNASLAAHTSLTQPGSGAGSVRQAGFGTVLLTLLAPLLPTMDVVLNRLSGNRACWLQQQVSCGRCALSECIARPWINPGLCRQGDASRVCSLTAVASRHLMEYWNIALSQEPDEGPASHVTLLADAAAPAVAAAAAAAAAVVCTRSAWLQPWHLQLEQPCQPLWGALQLAAAPTAHPYTPALMPS
jgi:hypothetical protein